MTNPQNYLKLPLSWENKSPETIKNDCQWLESIIKNAAPFSDWWVKARIVQLAYQKPPSGEGKSTYAGLDSAAAIVKHLQDQCRDRHAYGGFMSQVNEQYIIDVLSYWHNKKFTQAISRNFEIYEDTHHDNVFLVTSTATVSLYVDRPLPPPDRYRPLFNVDEFAKIAQKRSCQQMTLRTHGYATSAKTFYRLFRQEADALGEGESDPEGKKLSDRHFYVGYHWPSETPFTSPGLWSDLGKNWGIVMKFAFVLGGFAGILGLLLAGFLQFFAIPLLEAGGQLPWFRPLWEWSNFNTWAEVTVAWYWVIPTLFVLWVVLMQNLRILVYQRDRYRAIHYGAPDLGEFFWRLDRALQRIEKPPADCAPSDPGTIAGKTIAVNLVGHSMGGLLLVNVLRILSDRFGKDDCTNVPSGSQIGDYLVLDKLILASPDIPLEFLREGRNNYVRSAMRRCGQIYLMSSDRDIVLRYMPTLGNWFSEPSIEMSGYRLGNLYLKPTADCNPDCKYRPYIRNLWGSQPAASPTSAYDLFERFNYLDCSEMKGVNGLQWPLSPYTVALIDPINTFKFLASVFGFPTVGKLDLHGGYFLTDTPTFAILKLLMRVNGADKADIDAGIRALIKQTPIRYLPSQQFLTRGSE